jgi:hypothetical protein
VGVAKRAETSTASGVVAEVVEFGRRNGWRARLDAGMRALRACLDRYDNAITQEKTAARIGVQLISSLSISSSEKNKM